MRFGPLELLILRQLFAADFADVFALELRNLFRAAAEDAVGLVLAQHDGRAVHVDLDGVALARVDVQGAAQFDGQDDAAQAVDVSYDSSRFHNNGTSSLYFAVAAIIIPDVTKSVNKRQVTKLLIFYAGKVMKITKKPCCQQFFNLSAFWPNFFKTCRNFV